MQVRSIYGSCAVSVGRGRIAPRYVGAVIFVLVALQCLASNGKEYRIGSQQQFETLSSATFLPGDVVLFERGRVFKGMFAPVGSGTVGAVIRVSTCGEGVRPRIDAGGKHVAGLLLQDPAYWEVSGLEITNSDGTERDQGKLFGIYVLVKGKEGTYRHLHIDDCYVHDVNSMVAGKKRGGIHVHIEDCKASRFDDLRITNNRVLRVGGVGIGNASSCARVEFRERETLSHNLWTNVYVAGNHVDRTGRNNVIARASENAVYEHNTLANSSRCDTGHSIFCFHTDGIRIQYNEAYGNVGEEGHDRGGFDADYNCTNTFIQYNYSHDNMWFCGIMKRRNRNVVVRYNVSQNDRRGIYFYGFEKNREADNIHIYNNTHFVRKGLDVDVFPEGRTPLNSLFENNIFFFEGEGDGGWGKNAAGNNTMFRNNLYFNISAHPSDTKPIAVDPLFVRPGLAGTNIDLRTMGSLQGYRLKLNSPCLDQGLSIVPGGCQDLFGTAVSGQRVDLGAVQQSIERSQHVP